MAIIYTIGGPVVWPAPTTAAVDLLATVVAYLRSTPSVTAVVPPAAVYDELAPAGATAPYLVVTRYREPKPGRTGDDQAVPLCLVIRTNGLDAARAAGLAVKNAVDTGAVNPNAIGRSRFTWSGGRERACLRRSRPRSGCRASHAVACMPMSRKLSTPST